MPNKLKYHLALWRGKCPYCKQRLQKVKNSDDIIIRACPGHHIVEVQYDLGFTFIYDNHGDPVDMADVSRTDSYL
ncbi:hypothetical protein BSNK01_08760 [Bacillaceae bacterium]